MTNGDKIRAMSDDDLARLLSDFRGGTLEGDCYNCPVNSYCEMQRGMGVSCYQAFKYWLGTSCLESPYREQAER